MAAEQEKIRVKLGNFAYVHRLAAGVSILAFFVIVVAGWRIDAPLPVRVDLIVWRAFVTLVTIHFITRIVVRILKTYEEMNSGQT